MSRVITTIVLALLFKVALAQQEPNFSQYMYNQTDYNPGSVGSKELISVTALGRQQWLGFPGKPTVSEFSVNSPIKKINSGVGLVLQNDNVGFNRDINVKLAYAYRINISEAGKMGIGISGGFRNKVFKPDGWLTPDGSSGNDASIPQSNESGMAFDMGLGLFYNSDDLYLGLSATNLLQSAVSYKTSEFNTTRHYYVTAGYSIPLKNSAFELQPSVFLMSDAVITSVDLNTVVMYNKRFWGGISYRINSGFVGMVGIELINGLRVGYSYDISTTDLNKYNNGTHELMIGYNFTIVKEKIPHKNKSVRFL